MGNRNDDTYKLDGWTAVRTPVGNGAPDRLTLTRHGDTVWEMEIPAGLPRGEWITIAYMIMDLYDRAWTDGFEACRRIMGRVMGA